MRSPYLRLPAKPLPAVPQASTQKTEAPGQKPKKQKLEKPPVSDLRYEQVEAALDGKFRQNLRRRRRRLAEQGEVKYVLLDGKDAKALDEGLADFFTIEGSGWKAGVERTIAGAVYRRIDKDSHPDSPHQAVFCGAAKPAQAGVGA